MNTATSDSATWGGLIEAYWPIVERIQKRLDNCEPVWYPEIKFLVFFLRLLVMTRRARTTEQQLRCVDMCGDLAVLVGRARTCREPQK